jgi:hypothetical protein
MATSNRNSKKSNLKLVPKTPKTKAGKTPDREAIIQEVLNAISFGDVAETPDTERESSYDPWGDDFLVNNHFAFNASQINIDLAQAALCELSHDFGVTDNNSLEFYSSSEYEKLRQTFLDGLRANLRSKTGHEDILLSVIYRAYNAGRLCPERLEPRSEYARKEHLRNRRKWSEEHKQKVAENSAKQATK